MKVFITGGTTGIGLALAKEYLKENHQVAICGRDLTKLPKGFHLDFPSVKLYELDVLNREKLKDAINDFSKDGLDLVVANAGRSSGSKTKIPNFEVSINIIETNIIGVLNTFAPAIDIMQKQGHGHLAAVASVAGLVGLPGSSAYSASKAAVLKLCESYDLDFHKFGINVTAIAPGFIDTPLTQQNAHTMPWLMSAEKAAKIIKKGLDKKSALLIFPWQMRIVMFILEKMPRFLYRSIMKLPVANYKRI